MWRKNIEIASSIAPRRSPLPRTKFQRARNTAARSGARIAMISKIRAANWPVPPGSLEGMRDGRDHGPIREKKTGRPCHAAASTRRGRWLYPGHSPVQAWRTSEAASDAQIGGGGWNLGVVGP